MPLSIITKDETQDIYRNIIKTYISNTYVEVYQMLDEDFKNRNIINKLYTYELSELNTGYIFENTFLNQLGLIY